MFAHGIPMTEQTPTLPILVSAWSNVRKRYRYARTMDKAFLNVIMSVIPGFNGAEKRGKGQNTQPGVIKLSNVKGESLFFNFVPDSQGYPVFSFAESSQRLGYMSRPAFVKGEPSPLTEIAFNNVQMIARAWHERELYPVALSTLNRRFAPHITAVDRIVEDTSYYMDRNAAEGNRAEEERERGIRLERALEQHLQNQIARDGITNGTMMKQKITRHGSKAGGYTRYQFYKVVPQGEITDGKGKLLVQYFKETWKDGVHGLPSMANLQPDVIAVEGRKLDIVAPGETTFRQESWAGD